MTNKYLLYLRCWPFESAADGCYYFKLSTGSQVNLLGPGTLNMGQEKKDKFVTQHLSH